MQHACTITCMTQVSEPTSGETAADVGAALIRVMTGMKARLAHSVSDIGPAVILFRLVNQAPLRVSDLASCVGLDASTVSRHVRALEEQALVVRTDDPEDRRASRLDVTDTGRAFVAAQMQARADVLAEVLADWSIADRSHFLSYLERLAVALTPASIPAATEAS